MFTSIDRPPSIIHFAFSPDVEDHALGLDRNLHSLLDAIEGFGAAVALFDTMKAQRRRVMAEKKGPTDEIMLLLRWGMIGARDGAIWLQSYYRVMQKANAHLHKLKPLSELADMEAKKRADKAFQATFPRIANVRDSAAHPVDLALTMADVAGHAAVPPASWAGMIEGENAAYVQGAMLNNEFTSTVNGHPVSYTVAQTSVHALDAITKDFFAAFEPLAQESQNLVSRMTGETLRQRMEARSTRLPLSGR